MVKHTDLKPIAVSSTFETAAS